MGVKLVILNWDDEHRKDILSGKGFDVTEPAFTKEKKNMNGLHSPRFATDWEDDDAFRERYRCNKCGHRAGRQYEGEVCPKCKQGVIEYKDDDLSLTAWIGIDNYHIIHPIYFSILKAFIGKNIFPQIITYNANVTLNGGLQIEKNDSNPFAGIGMVEFYNQYYKIIRYFKKKNKKKPKKMELAEMLRDKNKVFAKHIPVYSSVLREVSFKGDNYIFNKIDTKFNTIFSQSTLLNDNDKLLQKINKEMMKKSGTNLDKLELPNILFDIQKRLLAAWDIIFNQITTKNGHIRDQILGGRVDYSGRSVIRPDPTLKADEIEVCYLSFLELYKYEIQMYLSRLNNISMSAASDIWYYARLKFDETVYAIMQYIIDSGHNFVDLNRNPTINYGSYMTMKIARVTKELNDNYTMALPAAILTAMNADFDGDTLNQFSLKTHELEELHEEAMSPVKNMFVNRADGLFNDEMNLLKDQIIGLYQFNNI